MTPPQAKEIAWLVQNQHNIRGHAAEALKAKRQQSPPVEIARQAGSAGGVRRTAERCAVHAQREDSLQGWAIRHGARRPCSGF